MFLLLWVSRDALVWCFGGTEELVVGLFDGLEDLVEVSEELVKDLVLLNARKMSE
jgi:hypothetical protein